MTREEFGRALACSFSLAALLLVWGQEPKLVLSFVLLLCGSGCLIVFGPHKAGRP